MNKPTVPEVLPLVWEFAKKNPVGGVLHIVLDDGNVADHDVEWCVERAYEEGDDAGARLGVILLKMSKTQRKKIARLYE